MRQGISPEMARRYHSQYEGVEGIGIVCVGGEVGRGVFGIVGGGYFSPGAAPVMSQLQMLSPRVSMESSRMVLMSTEQVSAYTL